MASGEMAVAVVRVKFVSFGKTRVWLMEGRHLAAPVSFGLYAGQIG